MINASLLHPNSIAIIKINLVRFTKIQSHWHCTNETKKKRKEIQYKCEGVTFGKQLP